MDQPTIIEAVRRATVKVLGRLTGPSPADGQVLVYVADDGELTLMRAPSSTATGPGGDAGADSGAAVTLPDPLASDGYGLYHTKLTANCTATLPAPATVGSRFVLRATQDSTGGRTLSFAASPAVVFPGVQLSLNTAIGADNWIAFECALDGAGNPTWYGFPATSSVANLSDIADPDAARHNLRVPILRSCIRRSSTNVALSGLQTIDGHTYVDGERHFCSGQTAGAENGPWVVHSGAWTRPTDYPAGASFRSRIVAVDGGTYANSLWMFNNDAGVTVGTTSTTWVRLDAGGAATLNYAAVFGDQSDDSGTVTLATGGPAPGSWCTYASDVYTLARDTNLNHLTINSGVTLKLNGYRLFCAGTLTNNGTIGSAGSAAAADVAGAKTNAGSINGGQAGAAGGTGVGAIAGISGAVGNGGAGGAGTPNAGGVAKSANVAGSAVKNTFNNPAPALTGVFQTGGTSSFTLGGGTGGSAGGGDGTNKGGGGGSGGPPLLIFAAAIVNNGTITSTGGAGGNAATGNCGGGGGGSGGLILIYTLAAVTGSGTIVVTGGAAGTGVGTGVNGSAGGVGQSLTVVVR